jgi:indole-3-glycerol phosphate synthase
LETYLDRILDRHRAEAEKDNRIFGELFETAERSPLPRGFLKSLETDGLSVIAEVKRKSPSKGALAIDLNPSELAKKYEIGGAACVSVLTDTESFGGSPGDLQVVRESVDLPVLRKDFTVHEFDILDARIMGADAVLLIAAALVDEDLKRFHELARELRLDVLVEVHDEIELERAISMGANLIGVNQRDLYTFEVDHERALRMGDLIGGSVTSVAESGVRDAADAATLAQAGFDAVLVGEILVTSEAPDLLVRAMTEVDLCL